MTTTLLRLLKILPATISDYSPGMRSAVDRSALYQEAEVGVYFLVCLKFSRADCLRIESGTPRFHLVRFSVVASQ